MSQSKWTFHPIRVRVRELRVRVRSCPSRNGPPNWVRAREHGVRRIRVTFRGAWGREEAREVEVGWAEGHSELLK